MAAALLVGTNLNAKVLSASDGGGLTKAFDDATSGDTIRLGAAITQNECITIASGKVLYLDMNGKSITFTPANDNLTPYNFMMRNSSLFVYGGGAIKNEAKPSIAINGDNTKGIERIDKDTIYTDETKTVILRIDNDTIWKYNNYKGAEIVVFYVQGSTDPNTTDSTVLSVASGTQIDAVYGKTGITVYRVDENNTCAYGVKVLMAGLCHGEKYGIQLSGTVNHKPGTPGVPDDAKFPYFYIMPGSIVWANPTKSNGVGAYAAGYGIWKIEGTVHGSTGVYVKGGSVEIHNATIYSDNNSDTGIRSGKGSGVDAGGNAIATETNGSYAGYITVTISGTSTVTAGTHGYAIEDKNTKPNSESEVEAVTITGGTFTGGTSGCITLDEGEGENIQVTVTGGIYNGDIDDIVEHMDEAAAITPIEVDDGQGGTTTVYVVSKVDDPQYDGWDDHTTGAFDYNDEHAYIILKNDAAISANTTSKINSLKILGAYTLTIPSTGKLEVDQIVMVSDAQIVVNAGGQLIVKGSNGIVAENVNNLIINSQEANTGLFLLSPSVASNKNPKATVNFTSKSYRNSSSDRVNQRFGIPTISEVENISIEGDVPTAFWEFNGSTWTSIGYLNTVGQPELDKTKLGTPFRYYQMQHNKNYDANGTKVTMKGNLVGIANPEMSMIANAWNGMANSYMGNVSCYAFVSALISAASSIDGTVYYYAPAGISSTQWIWDAFNMTDYLVDGTDVNLEPMQAFLVKNNGAATSITLDYQTLVWDPVMNSSPAPARQSNNFTCAKVMVADANGQYDKVVLLQGEEFSADYEKGYDAEKYMNETYNLYANAGDMFQSNVATDNLENMYLGFSCVEGGTYTISFASVKGESLTLIDLVSNTRVAIEANTTYQFSVADNYSNDYRFKIVGRQEMPTDVETIESNTVKAEGIYTITGQYLGEMNEWNSLPAGLYIVNGEKKVK